MGLYALTAALHAYCVAAYSKSSDRNAAVSRPGTALLRTLSVETGYAAVRDTLGLGLTSQAVPAVFQRKRSSHAVCRCLTAWDRCLTACARSAGQRRTTAALLASDPAALGGADSPLARVSSSCPLPPQAPPGLQQGP